MPQVAVITDSIACLTRELAEQYQILVVPINFYAGGKLYRDWVDVTPSQAYELFLQDPDSFKTSAASPEDCLEAYRRATQRAQDILFVTVSTKLSSVFNMAYQARERAKSELPGHNIEILNSVTATAAEGLVVLAAARAAAQDKSLAEAKAAAEQLKGRVHAIIFLDTIRHVYRSGRIPKIAAQVGSVLSIRPIFTIPDGTVHFTGAVLNKEHGIKRMLEMMKSKVGDAPVHVSVMHAYDLDEALKLRDRVESDFKCVELWISEFSPVMGYATGTGTLGLAFYTEA